MDAEQLNRELENMIGDDGTKVPGLGVIIYRDGAEVFSKFAGRRILGEVSKPVTRHTRFRAASVSKMFTIFSVMQLVEHGKLNLDAEAGNYLGFELRNPNCPQKKITVRALASHTSTLRDGKIYSIPPDMSVEEFFTPEGAFWEGGAHFAKVDGFSYCNLNYGLLGTIIEKVTGERFDLYQKKNILRRLDTQADYLPSNLTCAEFDLLGTIYRKKNPQGIWDEFGAWYGAADDFGGVQPVADTIILQNPYDEAFQREYSLKTYRAGTNATVFSPQGGLRISFEELAHALEMLMNGGTYRGEKILSAKSVETMLKPHWTYDAQNPNGDTCGGVMLSYGLGVYAIDGKKNNRVCKSHAVNLLGHTGAAFGMLSGLFFIPNTRTGFVYMMNGTALDEDNDPRSKGSFSDNYIWEERIMNAICEFLR